MFDKRKIKGAAKRLGFYVQGNFLIGTRNADILSGLAIDGAPSSTYIWTFLLPAFDDIKFMHMSLGERIVDISSSKVSLESAISETWRDISRIKNASGLLEYLDSRDVAGEYAEWSRFVCSVRVGDIERASILIAKLRESARMESTLQKLEKVDNEKAIGGWEAVQNLLERWSKSTDSLFHNIPFKE